MNRNRRKMAGRWLGGCPLLFPKIAGFVLNRCKMAGRWFAWLALAISYNFRCDFGSLGDGWRWLGDSWENTCCIITPNKKNKTISTTHNHTVHKQHKTGWLGGWLSLSSNVNLNCREMAGRWLGGWPHLVPTISFVIACR